MDPNFPKGEISEIKGKFFLLEGNDIDTDRIIPARFLKCVTFDDLGESVFADDRKASKGSHPFDNEINQNCNVLIVENNFGCGSSREHAPQALLRWGIRAIIGKSFAEIFYSNCLAIGIPCFTISDLEIQSLKDMLKFNKVLNIQINLIEETININNQKIKCFIKKSSKEMFITGRWDATSLLMSNSDKIDETISKLPYITKFT